MIYYRQKNQNNSTLKKYAMILMKIISGLVKLRI
jgi:hypothetical protein